MSLFANLSLMPRSLLTPEDPWEPITDHLLHQEGEEGPSLKHKLFEQPLPSFDSRISFFQCGDCSQGFEWATKETLPHYCPCCGVKFELQPQEETVGELVNQTHVLFEKELPLGISSRSRELICGDCTKHFVWVNKSLPHHCPCCGSGFELPAKNPPDNRK